MAFVFRLEQEHGTPADPPTLKQQCRIGVPATRARAVHKLGRPAESPSLQGESGSRTARRRGPHGPAAVRPVRAKSHFQPRFVSE
jgi:hypothetical protein